MSDSVKYTKHITKNGITSFRLNGKRIARRNIPEEVLMIIDKPVQMMDKSNIEYSGGEYFDFTVGKNILGGKYSGYTYWEYDMYDNEGNKTGKKRRMYYCFFNQNSITEGDTILIERSVLCFYSK